MLHQPWRWVLGLGASEWGGEALWVDKVLNPPSPVLCRYRGWAPSAHQALAHCDTSETWQAGPQTPQTTSARETRAAPKTWQPRPTRPVRP